MAVITLSREVGSGGEEIARRVCDVLRYRYFDKELMIEAAADLGLAQDHVVDYSEDRYEVQNFFARLFRSGPRPIKTVPGPHTDAAGNVTPSAATIDEGRYVELIKSAIQAAYSVGDVVILGRGGQAILQDKSNVLHVRVVAPLGSRLERLHRVEKISLDEAQQKIGRQDRATAEYLARFFGIRWDDATLYHLVINTGKLGIEGSVQLIVDAVVQLRAASMA
ncbi:MAG: cytidylate kinase-like family protein [Chloroflexi bacterium]|nr:cytidylate kinase-like family protein [Chloroflexota bacterium]